MPCFFLNVKAINQQRKSTTARIFQSNVRHRLCGWNVYIFGLFPPQIFVPGRVHKVENWMERGGAGEWVRCSETLRRHIERRVQVAASMESLGITVQWRLFYLPNENPLHDGLQLDLAFKEHWPQTAQPPAHPNRPSFSLQISSNARRKNNCSRCSVCFIKSPSRCWKKKEGKIPGLEDIRCLWVKEEPQNYIKLLLIGKPARFSNSTRQISESPIAFRRSLWAFGRSLLLFVKCWTPCRRCCAGSCRRCRPYLLPCQVVALRWCWILIPKHDLCSFCNYLVVNLVLLFGIMSRCLSSTQLQVNQPNWMK